MEAKFIQYMDEVVHTATLESKVHLLRRISDLFAHEDTPSLLQDVVLSSSLIKELAEVMAQSTEWANSHPAWVRKVVMSIYYNMRWSIPKDQTQSLVNVVAEYFSISESLFSLTLLVALVSTPTGSLHVLESSVYGIQATVREILKLFQCEAQRVIQSALFNAEWSQKILQDTQFLLDLLLYPSEDMWAIFVGLSMHPDSKTLLPQAVFQQASKYDNSDCITICANLCNESDAVGLKLSSTFVANTAKHLENLLKIQNQQGAIYEYGILSLTVPLVNLSIADANKERLGEKLIPLLKAVLSIERDKPLIGAISRNLDRGKQECAKTLWNLAFAETNRARIAANGGLDTLTKILGNTSDDVLKRNIEGILYMFVPANATKQSIAPLHQGGHVMISYNWANQQTVIRLAKSLTNRGYNIWLDVERMKGSILEAMAEAIEGAEVVLMCMTQKYKDSPNCRLEGEYCVNRKIDFIPLMLQNEYKPDGWLGIVLGSKLFYSFSSEENWESKIYTLVEVLGERGRGSNANKVHHATTETPASQTAATPTTSSIPTPKKRDSTMPFSSKPVSSWSKEDLKNWMKVEGIEHHFDTFVKHKLDGKKLLALKTQKPAALYLILKEYLHLTYLGDAVEVVTALQKLN